MLFYLRHYHRSRGYLITGNFIYYTGVAEYCVWFVCTTGDRNHILQETVLENIFLPEICRLELYVESVIIQYRRGRDFYSTQTIVTIQILIFQ